MRVGIRIAVAAVVLSAIAPPAPAAEIAALGDTWTWVTNDRFELLTNGSERRGRMVLEQLESFRAALAQMTAGQVAESPAPIRVVLFNRAWDFAPYQWLDEKGKPATFGGYFVRRDDTNYIVLSNDWGDEVPRIVFHEFSHYLVAQHLGRLPAWLGEGLAEYFAGFRYLERSRRVDIGRPIAEHMRYLNASTHAPLEQILGMTYDSTEFSRDVPRHLFYAKSWLLVHYLQIGSPARAGALARFAQNLAAGMPQVEALESAAGCSIRQLDDELLAYQRKSLVRYSSFELAAGAAPPKPTARPATREEVAYRLGEYLLALDPSRTSAIEAHFAAAGRPVPTVPRTYAAFVPESGAATIDVTPATLDELRETVRQSPDSVGALSELAITIYRQEITASPPDPALLAEARRALHAAARLEPGNFDHAADLLRLHRLDLAPGDLEPTLAALAAALAANPLHDELRAGYTQLLLQRGDTAEARRIAQAGLDATTDGSASEQLVMLLAEIDSKAALELARQGRVAEAEALLTARIEATPQSGWRRQLEQTLVGIRKSGRHNEARATYQRAVELTKAGEYDRAIVVLRELVASEPPAAVDEVARKALAQLEELVAALRNRRRSPPGSGS